MRPRVTRTILAAGVSALVLVPAARTDPTQQFAVESVAADGSGATRLAASPWPLGSPAFSPDGRTVSFVLDSATVELVGSDGTGGRALGAVVTATFYAVVFGPIWSPGGKTLIAPVVGYPNGDPRSATASLYRFDASTGSVGPLHPGRYASFSRDGRYLAYQTRVDPRGGGGVIGVCRSDGSHDVPFGRGSYAAWAPTTDRVAYVTRPGYLTVSGATGRARWTLRGMTAGPIAWLPGGRTIVFAHGGRRPALFLASPGARAARRLAGLPASAGAPSPSVSVSADGRWIATSRGSSTVLVRGDGTHLQVLHAEAAAWSPRASILALVSGNTLSLWTPGGGARPVYTRGQGVAEPSWSPDGTRVLVVVSGS